MMKVCKTCTFFDPFCFEPHIEKSIEEKELGVCTWPPPPLVKLLMINVLREAKHKRTGQLNWPQLFREPVTSAKEFCSCWSVNTALAEAKPDHDKSGDDNVIEFPS